MNYVSAALRALFVGEPFGNVYPPRPRPAKTAIEDGRTAALRILARYIGELTFFRPNNPGMPPIAFKIAPEDIHIEWPDHEEVLKYPAVAFIQVEKGDYDAIGLTTLTLEESRDLYGYGTVLQQQSQYVENFELEVHGSLKPERRAIIKGLEEALVPTEYMYGIRFRMPDYYNQTCTFTLNSRKLDENADAARHRRIGRMTIQLTYNVVALINYVELRPQVNINVQVDEASGDEVVLDVDDLNTKVNPP